MKKLIDILEYHIPNYEEMAEEQQDDLLVAVEEWAKGTPTYKPLSELYKDEKAAREVFNELSKLLGHASTDAQFEEWKQELSGSQKVLYDNIFKAVRIIQDAGYSA